ncbi:hypothetical protein THAOC_30586, partial [Thalassiosira oceanica]
MWRFVATPATNGGPGPGIVRAVRGGSVSKYRTLVRLRFYQTQELFVHLPCSLNNYYPPSASPNLPTRLM